MASVTYQITLQSEGVSSGPYYVVTYTTGAYFQPVISGSPAYLPNVGSTANIVIPSAVLSSNYLAFNLNNGIGGGCELCDNDVVLIITGSEPTFSCCTPTLNSVILTGSLVNIGFTLPASSSCLDCASVTIQTSTDGVTWGNNNVGVCTSPRSLTAPTASCTGYTTYYRLYQTCTGSVTSSFSNTGSLFTSGSGDICCAPTLTSVAPSGSMTSSLFINYSVNSDTCCISCSYITLTTSSNGVDWGSEVTASCTGSQFIVPAPACNVTRYYRLQQTCSGSATSSFSNTGSFYYPCTTTTTTTTSTTTTTTTLPSGCQQIFLFDGNASSCTTNGDETLYWCDNALAPTIFYTVDDCSTVFAGGSLYYTVAGGGTSYQINNSGLVIDEVSC
jgi:hypothetical protein